MDSNSNDKKHKLVDTKKEIPHNMFVRGKNINQNPQHLYRA